MVAGLLSAIRTALTRHRPPTPEPSSLRLTGMTLFFGPGEVLLEKIPGHGMEVSSIWLEHIHSWLHTAPNSSTLELRFANMDGWPHFKHYPVKPTGPSTDCDKASSWQGENWLMSCGPLADFQRWCENEGIRWTKNECILHQSVSRS